MQSVSINSSVRYDQGFMSRIEYWDITKFIPDESHKHSPKNQKINECKSVGLPEPYCYRWWDVGSTLQAGIKIIAHG